MDRSINKTVHLCVFHSGKYKIRRICKLGQIGLVKLMREISELNNFTVFHDATFYSFARYKLGFLLTWLQTFLYDQILTCGFKLDIAKNYTNFPVKCLRVTDVMKTTFKN